VTKTTRLGLMLLIGVLALSIVACGPKAATVKITVNDVDNKPLAGIVVTAGGQRGTTDASGVVTLKDVTPGQVAVKLSGDAYEHEATETVKAGDNSLTYKLSVSIGAIKSIDSISSMRIKVVVDYPQGSGSGRETAEAVLVRGKASSWDLGDTKIIVVDGKLYIKSYDDDWETFEGELGEMMAESYLAIGEMYLAVYADFADSAAGISQQQDAFVRYIGRETVNGYECRAYEARYSFGGQTLTHKAWVITSGPHAGYMTRYFIEMQGESKTTVDIYDLNQPLEVKKPI